MAERTSTRRRVVLSLAAALGLQAMIVYALIAGLTPQGVLVASSELVARILDETKVQRVAPAPPIPILAAPQLPSAPLPEIRIRASAPPKYSISTAARAAPTITAPQAPVGAGPAQPIPTAIGVQAVPGTHTAPPYPELARRLAEQGTVTIRIAITAGGAINDVAVLHSSGSARLDTAAVNWVKAHWKYRAASRRGVAVSSQVDAKIVFDLRNT